MVGDCDYGSRALERLALTELFMQQSAAPGRETTTTAPAQPATGAPAPAEGGGGASGIGAGQLLIFAIPILFLS